MLEAAPLGRPFQPILLCAYEVDVAPVFDATDADAREKAGASWRDLACPTWEWDMLRGQTPDSHRLAARLIADGYAAALVPSFAVGADPTHRNAVFWTWGPDLPTQVVVIDDHRRLPRDRGSWSSRGGTSER